MCLGDAELLEKAALSHKDLQHRHVGRLHAYSATRGERQVVLTADTLLCTMVAPTQLSCKDNTLQLAKSTKCTLFIPHQLPAINSLTWLSLANAESVYRSRSDTQGAGRPEDPVQPGDIWPDNTL